MRTLIVSVYPELLRPLLAWVFVAAAWAASREKQELRKALSKSVAPLALLFLVSLALRASTHREHRVFEDEVEHVDAAANLARGSGFALSLARGPGWTVTDAPLWPAGYHLLVSLAGGSEAAAFGVNALLGAATPPLAAVAALLLFDDAAAAAVAGGLLALWPAHVRFGGSTDLSISSVSWLALTLAAWGLRRRRRSPATAAFLAASLAYTLQCRLENALLLPLLLPEIGWPWAALPCAAALGPASIAALNASRAIPGYGGGEAGPWASLAAHLGPNVAYFLSPERGQLPLSALALLGAPSLVRRERAVCARLGGAALLFGLFYSCYHIGAFGQAAGERYALVVDLFVILAAAASAGDLWKRRGWARPVAALGVAAAVTAPLFSRAAVPEPPPGACEHALLKSAAPLMDQDGWVAAYPVASALVATGRPSFSPALLVEDPEGTLARLSGKPVYLVEDAWSEQRGEAAARSVKTALSSRSSADEILISGACANGAVSIRAFSPR